MQQQEPTLTNLNNVPKHVAIIMDGNGRWAKQKGKPRFMGHQAGVKTVRSSVAYAREVGVKSLTLFAFSSENWGRPQQEVSLLMELFIKVLHKEVKEMHKHNIRLNVVGDTTQFSSKLQQKIEQAHQLTANNSGLILNVAANYGGCWDITQAAKKLAEQVESGQLSSNEINEERLAKQLMMADQDPVDLLIRSGGDQRISNFVLWQAAYAELYFCQELWPDFTKSVFHQALQHYSSRQRRFGLTGEQVEG